MALLIASPSVKAIRVRDLRLPGGTRAIKKLKRRLKTASGISLLYFDAPSFLNKST
ncbi:hypothetical protein [Caballeronia hypogeia]|uniref:hypothetical protein n=1 Tax=Caballeronia hypogeia TaxID=1777140 RepID=UPI000B27B1FF|nr:hypothetical protein [Caballeronia hypogeia]